MKRSTPPTIVTEGNRHTVAGSPSQSSDANSGFAAKQVPNNIAARDVRSEFVSCALVARAQAKQTGQFVLSDEMLKRLDASLAAVRAKKATTSE